MHILYTRKEGKRSHQIIWIYPTAERNELESALDSEEQSEERVHVTENVTEKERSSVMLWRFNDVVDSSSSSSSSRGEGGGGNSKESRVNSYRITKSLTGIADETSNTM